MRTKEVVGHGLIGGAVLFAVSVVLGGIWALFSAPNADGKIDPGEAEAWARYSFWTDSVWPVFGVLAILALIVVWGRQLIESEVQS